MNLKVFNLLSGINETRFLVQHESRECKYGLNESVCNLKQKNGTMMNLALRIRNKMIGVLVKMAICEILTRMIVNVTRHVKLMNI